MKNNNIYIISLLFVFSFLGINKGWGQTNFTITYTGLTGNTAAVANPSNLFAVALTNTSPYTGVDASCNTNGNGATTSYATTITAKTGYSFTITSVTGTAYASNAGSKNFKIQISSSNDNFSTTTTTGVNIGTSTNCAGNTSIGTLSGAFTTTSGNSATITILRA